MADPKTKTPVAPDTSWFQPYPTGNAAAPAQFTNLYTDYSGGPIQFTMPPMAQRQTPGPPSPTTLLPSPPQRPQRLTYDQWLAANKDKALSELDDRQSRLLTKIWGKVGGGAPMPTTVGAYLEAGRPLMEAQHAKWFSEHPDEYPRLNWFARPLFQQYGMPRFAEGGIVSTVVGPEEQAAGMLQSFAQQSDITDQNIDNAEDIDSLLSAFKGQPHTEQDARAELAAYVGEEDAKKTPPAVLALVQPTFEMMKLAQNISPAGGISNVPMGEGLAEGAYDRVDPLVMSMPGDLPLKSQQRHPDNTSWLQNMFGMPQTMTDFVDQSKMVNRGAKGNMQQTYEGAVRQNQRANNILNSMQTQQGYAEGGLVRTPAEILAEREQIESGLPQRSADPMDAILAIAQFGRGLAEGPDFARGMQKATDYASPYAARAIDNKNLRRREDIAYVGAAMEADRKAAIDAQLQAQKFQHEEYLQDRDLQNKIDVELLKMTDNKKTAAMREAAEYFDPKTQRSQYLDKLWEIISRPGQTFNFGEKLDVIKYQHVLDREEKALANLQESADVASKNKVHIQQIKSALTTLGPDKQPAFRSGWQGTFRQQVGQFITLIGGDPSQIDLIGDPVQAEKLDANMKALAVGEGAKLARSTNLQVGFIADSLPNLMRTPQGNLVLADMYERVYHRDEQMNEYARLLMDTPGINTLYPEETGVQMPKFTEGLQPLDENGKPTMNLNNYRIWLDKNDPVVNADLEKRMRAAAKLPGAQSWWDSAKTYGFDTKEGSNLNIDFSQINSRAELEVILQAHKAGIRKLNAEQIKAAQQRWREVQ